MATLPNANHISQQAQNAQVVANHQEDTYRTLFESADQGICLIEVFTNERGHVADFIYRDANRAFLQHTGLPDVLGKRGSDVLPELEPQCLDLLTRVYQTGESVRAERFTAELDRWFTIQYVPVGGASSRLIGALFQDITRHKQPQQQQDYLLSLSDALRPLLDAKQIQSVALHTLGQHLQVDRVLYAEVEADQAHFVINANYVQDNFPPMIGRFQLSDFGHTPDSQRLGQTLVLADIHQVDEAHEHLRSYLAAGVVSIIGVPLRKGGRWVASLTVHHGVPRQWTDLEVALVEQTAERTWAALERARAENALRQSEEQYRQLARQLEARVQARTGELQQANADLQRSNDNLQQFAYVASHDLQEPLRKIQAFSTLLAGQLGESLDETSRSYLERITVAGARMSTLIRDLLAYSRIGVRQQAYGPVVLDAVVADVLATLDWQIEQSHAQLSVQALPVVNGDEGQLGQLFQNLLINALKFALPGQAPRVDIKYIKRLPGELPRGVRPSRPAAYYHQISVKDAGIGFDTKYLDRIFQVFQRLHGKSYAGTGVGLAICQRVVDNHGGTITADSQPGQGATFCIYLPA